MAAERPALSPVADFAPGGLIVPPRPIAIVSAMHEELRALLPLLRDPRPVRLAGRDFHQGTIHGEPVVLALSGIGKVAAATPVSRTATWSSRSSFCSTTWTPRRCSRASRSH